LYHRQVGFTCLWELGIVDVPELDWWPGYNDIVNVVVDKATALHRNIVPHTLNGGLVGIVQDGQGNLSVRMLTGRYIPVCYHLIECFLRT
jgi:hypothetical protein